MPQQNNLEVARNALSAMQTNRPISHSANKPSMGIQRQSQLIQSVTSPREEDNEADRIVRIASNNDNQALSHRDGN